MNITESEKVTTINISSDPWPPLWAFHHANKDFITSIVRQINRFMKNNIKKYHLYPSLHFEVTLCSTILNTLIFDSRAVGNPPSEFFNLILIQAVRPMHFCTIGAKSHLSGLAIDRIGGYHQNECIPSKWTGFGRVSNSKVYQGRENSCC